MNRGISVTDLWSEWCVGILHGIPSVMRLDEQYGTSWGGGNAGGKPSQLTSLFIAFLDLLTFLFLQNDSSIQDLWPLSTKYIA
jgi:hypothetical protein